MTTSDLQDLKARCLADLYEAVPRYAARLDAIDPRLTAYIGDAISDGGSHSNVYELLGIRKELRLMDSYPVDGARTRRVIRAMEGVWEGGRHVRGGLPFDTPRGCRHVRLMAYQVWCLFGIYAFTTEVAMERGYHGGDALLETEFVKEDGMVWDRRRLCQEAHLFQTRKSGKTEFGAAIDFVEACILGDANAQALICANSREQARIAYKAVKRFAAHIDPKCLNRAGGKWFRLTADELNWRPGLRMKGEIKVMSAGGKRKDGLYASIVHADEHGSAEYINGHSDMQSLVEVCWGSTGPRREKLLLHTTTAGLAMEAPYKAQLEAVQRSLEAETDCPLGEARRTDDDRWFAFLLQLDPWEQDCDLARLDDPELFRKVNRSIGITVQPTYYRERLHDAMTKGGDTRREVLTKDFNIWQQDRTTAWRVSGDEIRRLQHTLAVPDGAGGQYEVRSIADCLYSKGWNVFVGMDFGGNDDLLALSMLGVNYTPGLQMQQRFFADTYLWILEDALDRSPNSRLFGKMIEKGWLRVCPGKVFNPDYAIDELMSLNDMGVNLMMFGYDPAQSHDPINTIKAWLQNLGLEAAAIRDMMVPVSQNTMTMNPLVQKLEMMTLSPRPWLTFSANPLWPWMFSNVVLQYSRDGTLCRPQKSAVHRKIDGVAGLLDALAVFDLSESKTQ